MSSHKKPIKPANQSFEQKDSAKSEQSGVYLKQYMGLWWTMREELQADQVEHRPPFSRIHTIT